MNIAPKPTLHPAAEAEYVRARRLWHVLLPLPIAYLLLAQFLVRIDWIDADPANPHPLDTLGMQWAIGIVTVLVAGGLVWFRRLRPLSVRMGADEPEIALRRWFWDFRLMAILTDTLAFLGLVYFALSGHKWALFAWGAASYLGQVLVYPRRAELTWLGDPPRP